ncbi:MAG: hypothetical protein OQK73_06790 [Gammaproteobacteria bacterium]|nr:hypothetical protein [Gammaproteobacteria bacterium]
MEIKQFQATPDRSVAPLQEGVNQTEKARTEFSRVEESKATQMQRDEQAKNVSEKRDDSHAPQRRDVENKERDNESGAKFFALKTEDDKGQQPDDPRQKVRAMRERVNQTYNDDADHERAEIMRELKRAQSTTHGQQVQEEVGTKSIDLLA